MPAEPLAVLPESQEIDSLGREQCPDKSQNSTCKASLLLL